MRGVTWRAAPAKFKRGMCEMKVLGSEVLWCVFGTLVQDGLAHMHGVICSGLFRQSSKQGCVRWKFSDLKFVVCLGTLVQDGLAHMRAVTWRAAPAKFKTDVWDENLRVWGFVVYLWNIASGLAHMRGVIRRAAPAKLKRGMWEMKILGSEVLWCVFLNVGSGWVGTHAWCNLFRVVPAKFKTGMCEMKIFGSKVCSVSWDVGSGWVGSHAWCNMESCSGKVQNRCVRWKS